MSGADPVSTLLTDIDQPVAPRAEFAAALLERLVGELGAPLPAAMPAKRRRWRDRLLPNRSARLRLVLVAIALGLLLAGVATATYVGAQLVFETPPTALPAGIDAWSSFAVSPDGGALYALRVPRARQTAMGTPEPVAGTIHPGAPQLMRIGVGGGQHEAKLVLDFGELAKQGFSVQTGSGGGLSVAADGDVFLVVPAVGRDSLFVLHPDGSRQRILDGNELIEAKLFPAAGGVSFEVAASAPDRIWLLAGPWEGDSPQRLFELVDPNGDGDWSDRVLRPIAVPDWLPLARQWRRSSKFSFPAWRWQLAAEPALPADARTHSVLAAALSHETGELRIYRIADLNGDGDALDPGEATLVFDRPNGVAGQYPLNRAGAPPRISPLVVTDGSAAQREIAVAGLTSPDRVSLISESGAVTEIGGVFPNGTDWPANGLSVASSPQGALYAIRAASTDSGLAWSVYRLKP